MKSWVLYILECKDGTLYTGITTDINRRLKEHNSGSGAKSIRGKLPARLVYQETYQSLKSASKRERTIKSWKREYKIKLIKKS